MKILHFDQDAEPRWAGQVIVEDFQPHRLVCQPQTVLLEGAGNGGRGWVYYTLALGASGGLGIASIRNDPAHVFVPIGEPPNLGNWARPGIIPLRIESLSRHFQLRVTDVSKREDRLDGIHRFRNDCATKTEVILRDGVSHTVSRVFQGL